jgi:hypothetical protein
VIPISFIYLFVYLIIKLLIYLIDLYRKSVELAKDDTKQLYSCLLTCINYPKELLSKSMIDNLIAKLTKVKNSRVDEVLGKYYLKNEKV